MKKNLFKWMMALAVVASPMFFTSCGDDNDDNTQKNEEKKEMVIFTLSEGFSYNSQDALAVIKTVKTTMVTAMFSSVGQTFYPNEDILDKAIAIFIEAKDETKMLDALNVTYDKIKDTDMKGGYYMITLKKGTEVINTYVFGKDPDEGKVYIGFEKQQLNNQNFWIGNSAGKFTYTEEGVTITGTQSSYEGVAYWSGFAISGRKEKTYENLTPDQYNSAYGGTIHGDKFLVVYNPNATEGECITFDKPVKVQSMCCTNSAYAYSSMTKGDTYAKKFTKEDWFSCYITCFNENGDTISTTEVELAKKDVEKNKYLDYWHTVRIKAEKVKKITFSFDGSDKGEWGLNTPAYMCVDKIYLER